MWLKKKALSSWERPLCQRALALPPKLNRLVVNDSRIDDVMRVCETANVPWCGLALSETFSHVSTKDLSVLSGALRSLVVPDCSVQNLREILRDPAGRASTIEALVVGGVAGSRNMNKPRQFYDAIIQSSDPIRHTLRELSVESAVYLPKCLETLAESLELNRGLRYLQVRGRARGGSVEAKFAAVLGPTERSKVWLYTFLVAVRRSARWNVLPSECRRLVVEFAAVQARRQVVLLDP